MLNIADLDVDMVNVHAAGGIEMMKAAKRALDEKGSNAHLLAVTILTSLQEREVNNELLITGSLEDTVSQYAYNAYLAGLHGVVCSPMESKKVKDRCGSDFLTVTPGIRFLEDEKGDQKRVTTPSLARELTSSYIVMGRSITGSKDPVSSYRKAMREFCGE